MVLLKSEVKIQVIEGMSNNIITSWGYVYWEGVDFFPRGGEET